MDACAFLCVSANPYLSLSLSLIFFCSKKRIILRKRYVLISRSFVSSPSLSSPFFEMNHLGFPESIFKTPNAYIPFAQLNAVLQVLHFRGACFLPLFLPSICSDQYNNRRYKNQHQISTQKSHSLTCPLPSRRFSTTARPRPSRQTSPRRRPPVCAR
ncbi:hypothetical protein DM02DRAFT_69481 [Periconia macrospinosa]|uniref:Uncharacterized protein n=1 Tax=Periconia macrospinosa TaxID=97972 RepID=A0A2V1E546_9PLEO|nr:hypothetical protein DM02DRAFT_69481 [Periconia macrospinosa]